MQIELESFFPYMQVGTPSMEIVDLGLSLGKALRIDSTASQYGRWFTGRDVIPVVPGHEYEVSCTAMVDYRDERYYTDSSLPAAEFAINFWDVDGNHCKTERYWIRAPQMTSFTSKVTATEQAEFIRFELRLPWIEGTLWGKDFTLFDLTEPEPDTWPVKIGDAEMWLYENGDLAYRATLFD